MIFRRSLSGLYHPTVVIDVAERVLVTLLFLNLCVRFYSVHVEDFSIIYLLIVVSELLVVVFIVYRKMSADISMRVQDWAVAGLGTCLPLTAIAQEPFPVVSPFACLCVMLFGICLQLTSKIFLNRSFGIVPANRGVKTRGPYAFIRHPIYFGYTLTQIGFLLFAPNVWNLCVYLLGFAFQVSRIFREELVLSGDPAYRDYATAVPYRLVPGIF